ncbi:ParB family protein [Alloalcanivorax xenomutans]|uniref:Integrating conjugative element, PFGI_1 class, ParB family protein n=1 Tax=Alcanivorax xiamenensis TaxID=1177156 RepID=A0ABQ6Y253_9GAMM|nr:ParB family protein [Alcanivorax xiamenensis]KAF0801886.1 hypothetical protein A6D6_04218 [Alcanivorax xiamenensis]
MSKKRPSSEQVASLIATPLFRRDQRNRENGDGVATPSTDPITSTPMRMDVDQIRRYDHDPRRNRNSKYAEIKASILAAGDQEDPLESPLVVTKRPGDPDPRYMVSAGGNTRLCILQELWKETGNERFKQTWVIFKPWDSECRTLLSHLKENDLRGDLIFIDRALAIRNVRELILEEQDREKLSQREFAEVLDSQGYRVSQSLIVWYDYAVDVLYPLLPSALDNGMGRPQVERLRGLHNAFRDVCQAFGLGEDIEGLFGAVVSRNDQSDIDLDHIRRELESEISVSADCDIGRASLALGAALDGGEILVPNNDAEDDLDFLDATAGSGNLDDYGYADNAGEASTQENSDDTESDDGHERLSFGVDDDLPGQAPTTTSQDEDRVPVTETPASSSVSESSSRSTVASETTPDLADLRSQAWDLAAAIAAEAGLSEPLSLPESGFGFVLLPEPADGHAACVWWQLANLAGQHPNQAALADHLPPDWLDHVPTFNPFHLASELYLHWSDAQWRAFTKLVALIRSIHSVTEGDPWIS